MKIEDFSEEEIDIMMEPDFIVSITISFTFIILESLGLVSADQYADALAKLDCNEILKETLKQFKDKLKEKKDE